MLTYDSLIENVCGEFSEVSELYDMELRNDSIDSDSGVHTVFSFCFVPVLKDAIVHESDLAKRMFDYLEKMEMNKDNLVGEVAEFTVLEEILDEFDFNVIKKYMGTYTLEAAKLINRYISQ
jgi:hypothetical protein